MRDRDTSGIASFTASRTVRVAAASLTLLVWHGLREFPTVSAEPPASSDDAASETASSGDSSSSADPKSEEKETSASTGGDSNGSTAPEPSYELRELVVRAKTNEALVDEFEAKRNKAEWKQFQADWGAMPRIESRTTIAPVPADAEPSRLQENADEITNLEIGPVIDQQLDLLIPVYTFGRVDTYQALADIGVDVADLKRREAILNVVYQTKRAFYSLQLSRRFETILERGDDRVETRLEKMREARQFGTADFETRDFRQLQIFATEVDERRADNDKLAEVASSGLTYLADLEVDRPKVGALSEDGELPPLHDREAYLEVAKRHRPDLKQLNRAVRARSLQADLARQSFYPNLFIAFKFGVSWSTESTALQPICRRDVPDGECAPTGGDKETGLFARPYSDPLNRLSVNIVGGLEWKFDFFRQYGKVQAKQANARALEAKRRRALGAMRLEVKKQYKTAANHLEKVEIHRRELEAARRWRDQVGYAVEKMDAKDFKDAIDPIRAYYKAKANYLRARYKYLVARASLAQKIGLEWLDVVRPDGTVRSDGPPAVEANDGP